VILTGLSSGSAVILSFVIEIFLATVELEHEIVVSSPAPETLA
jgi:hypothetical protein